MQEQTTSGQQVGTVFILYGEAQAVNQFGQARTLSVNDPIHANEQIITGVDGKLTIHFDNAGAAPLDIGRSSHFTVDPDVYLQTTSEDLSEATSSVEEMQIALENQAIDPTTAFEAPASGNGVANAGGGISTAVFDFDGREVTPEINPFGSDGDGFNSDFSFTDATHLGFLAPEALPVPAVTPPKTVAQLVVDEPAAEPVEVAEAPVAPCLENVQTAVIYETYVGNTTYTVDYWYFTAFSPGDVTMNFLSELGNGTSWIDIDGNGVQEGLDTDIHLFTNDGHLDAADWIDSNDDNGNLSGEPGADGSTHGYDSFLQTPLAAGNYVLAVSSYNFGQSEAVSGVNTGGWIGGGPYQVTFSGDLALTFGPNCALPQVSISDATAQESTLGTHDPTEGSAFITEFEVTGPSSQFSFDYNFSTDDYMPWNDYAFVSIDGELIILDDAARVDTDGGATTEETGVRHFSINLDTGQHSVTFGVLDGASDTIVNSSVTISNQMLGGEALSPDNNNEVGEVTQTGSDVIISNAGASVDHSDIETAMDTSHANQGIAAPPTDLSTTTAPYEDSTAEFTVSIDEAVPYDVTVDYTTNDGSATGGADFTPAAGIGMAYTIAIGATGGADFTPAAGTVTIAAGETEATVQVDTLPDADNNEGTENFTVELSNPDGATIDDGTGDGEILDSLVGTP